MVIRQKGTGPEAAQNIIWLAVCRFTLGKIAMVRAFQIASYVCAIFAIAIIAIAVLKPIAASWLLNVGIALLLMAFLATLARHYFSRWPIPVRGGALVTIEASPVAYYIWYLGLLSICCFLIYLLLHSLV